MRLDRISFSYGEKIIFKDFSLDFPEGKVTAVLGPSGVGKSTLLHLLSGLVAPASGVIEKRAVSYMFQEPRLLPSLDMLSNLTVIPDVTVESALRWLSAVGLSDSVHLYPRALSGGMAQRVSLARAFAFPSDLLLMDEPFKGLDLSLRMRLYEVFLSLWQERRITSLLITHDPEEAIAMASQVVVLGSSPAEVVYSAAVTEDTRRDVYQSVRQALMSL